MKNKKIMIRLSALPYGAVVKYRKELWFKSRGLCGDILTSALTGRWKFINRYGGQPVDEITWKSFHVVYSP